VPLEGWVWRIVINEALKQRRERAATELALVDELIPAPNGHPDSDLAVRRWIADLPERQRLAVFLRYYAALDYRSIAGALDIEVGTVSATLASAHAALRRSYQ
jgi:RNA polymerase sigma factor (sigma-70 family)